MTKIIFVRHGETVWNKQNRVLGWKNIRLSKLGREQAVKLAKRLKNEKIDAIYTSKLSRAVDTAKEINKFHKLKMISVPELNEVNFGIWEGVTWDEAKEKYPDVYTEREKRIYNYKLKKGESNKEVWTRVYKVITDIIEKHPDKTVLIVSHGAVKMLLLRHYLKKSIKELRKEKYHNAGITILEIKNKKAKFHVINDVSHLD
jgi:broad specificity phosphatase PhoE